MSMLANVLILLHINAGGGAWSSSVPSDTYTSTQDSEGWDSKRRRRLLHQQQDLLPPNSSTQYVQYSSCATVWSLLGLSLCYYSPAGWLYWDSFDYLRCTKCLLRPAHSSRARIYPNRTTSEQPRLQAAGPPHRHRLDLRTYLYQPQLMRRISMSAHGASNPQRTRSRTNECPYGAWIRRARRWSGWASYRKRERWMC